MRARIKRIWTLLAEEFALLSAEFILVLLIGIASVIIFIRLSALLITKKVVYFDDTVYAFINRFSSEPMTLAMKAITFLGNTETMTVCALLILFFFLFIKPHRWYSISIPVVALGSIMLNVIMKRLFDRPRPVIAHLVDVSGLSFPSGHAMFSFSFYGLLIYIIWNLTIPKLWKYSLSFLLLILSLLIGISRIYLGVHYPSDVSAGFAAGFIWLFSCLVVLRLVEKRLKNKEKEQAIITSAEKME